MDDREYSEYFDKIFKEHCKGREDHEFVFQSDSLGVQFYGKEHYKQWMKAHRMVPYNETERLAEQWDNKNQRKEYNELSTGAMDIIKSLRLTADKNGNIHLGSRAIKAMQEIGAIGNGEHRPEGIQHGFS